MFVFKTGVPPFRPLFYSHVESEDSLCWYGIVVTCCNRIAGLDEQVDEKILLAAFIPFGEVKEVSIPIDAGTGLKRGFGFVEFEEADDAAEARENMNSTCLIVRRYAIDAELFGKVLKVSYSKQMRANLISSKPSILSVVFLWLVWAQIDSLSELVDDEEKEVEERYGIDV